MRELSGSTLERLRAVHLRHLVAGALPLDCHQRRRGAVAHLLVQPPAAEVVRHAEHAGPDAFGDPRARDEVADARPHLDEIAGVDAEAPRVRGRDPQRVVVRDLVEPLHRRARVDERRQPEIREQIELAVLALQVAPVHVPRHVARDRVLGPAPVDERLRSKLEPARRRREAGDARRRRRGRRSATPSLSTTSSSRISRRTRERLRRRAATRRSCRRCP